MLIQRNIDLRHLMWHSQTLLLAKSLHRNLNFLRDYLPLHLLLFLYQLLKMLSYDTRNSILIFWSILIKLQIQWIVEQIHLFLTNLRNDLKWLMVLLNKHINYLAGDFGLFSSQRLVCVLLHDVLKLELLIHGLGELNVGVFGNVAGELVVLSGFAPGLFVLSWSTEAVLVTDILTCKIVILLVLWTISHLFFIIFDLNVAFIKMLHENT